jgi:hypothetical protein
MGVVLVVVGVLIYKKRKAREVSEDSAASHNYREMVGS